MVSAEQQAKAGQMKLHGRRAQGRHGAGWAATEVAGVGHFAREDATVSSTSRCGWRTYDASRKSVPETDSQIHGDGLLVIQLLKARRTG